MEKNQRRPVFDGWRSRSSQTSVGYRRRKINRTEKVTKRKLLLKLGINTQLEQGCGLCTFNNETPELFQTAPLFNERERETRGGKKIKVEGKGKRLFVQKGVQFQGKEGKTNAL